MNIMKTINEKAMLISGVHTVVNVLLIAMTKIPGFIGQVVFLLTMVSWFAALVFQILYLKADILKFIFGVAMAGGKIGWKIGALFGIVPVVGILCVFVCGVMGALMLGGLGLIFCILGMLIAPVITVVLRDRV